MKRKGISVVLAAVMIAGMAAGCGEKGSSDAAERKDTKLTLIHDMNEDSAISFLEQAIEQFEEKNPDVKIDMETLSSDDYNSMLRNKIAADDVPDLFFIDDIHKKQEFIDAGICMDISGEEWLNENIKESAVEACSVDGKTWCLPFTQGGMFVIYNRMYLRQQELSRCLIPGVVLSIPAGRYRKQERLRLQRGSRSSGCCSVTSSAIPW